jgi:hypothetical protein
MIRTRKRMWDCSVGWWENKVLHAKISSVCRASSRSRMEAIMVKTKMMLMKLLMMILRVNGKFVYECTSFRGTVSERMGALQVTFSPKRRHL